MSIHPDLQKNPQNQWTDRVEQSETRRPQPMKGRAAFVLLLVGCVVAALLGFFVVRMARMHTGGVPADLDFSTTRLSQNQLFRISYVSDAAPVPISQMHSWRLHVETPDGVPVDDAIITVSGDMPQHGHGMPTRPQVTQNLGNGDYLVEGMRFQMGGWWAVDFLVQVGDQTDIARFNLNLSP